MPYWNFLWKLKFDSLPLLVQCALSIVGPAAALFYCYCRCHTLPVSLDHAFTLADGPVNCSSFLVVFLQFLAVDLKTMVGSIFIHIRMVRSEVKSVPYNRFKNNTERLGDGTISACFKVTSFLALPNRM